jgi:hypothetical protein
MSEASKQMREVPRDAVERVAKVFGAKSAAARALADADKHDGPVQFFQCGNTILLGKSPPAMTN